MPTELIQTLPPALLVAILVGVLKGFIPDGPTGPANRDNLVRALALSLGVALGVADYLFNTARITGTGTEHAAGGGLIAGIGAILTYHVVSGDLLGVITGATPPPNSARTPPATLPLPAGALPAHLLGTTGAPTTTMTVPGGTP